ncbi:helix-turn-helix domain-containing protein [Parapedobacter luteus]|nr:helix-turn-helix domain-containing protein [Parapedobacter luteus]
MRAAVMPSYILVAVICVSLLSVYISVRAGLRSPMERYIRCFLGYLALHATHAWLVRIYFPDNLRLDYLAPYGLLYGPSLYFAYQVAAGLPLKMRHVLPHTLPFFVFLVCYLLWLAFPSWGAAHARVLGLSLYGTLSLSFLLYAIWALFFRRASPDAERNEDIRMVSVMAMVLAFIAVVFLVFTYSGFSNGYFRSRFQGSIIFLTMLSAAMILFANIIRRLVARPDTAHEEIDPIPEDEIRRPADTEDTQGDGRYQKSAISPELLDAYEGELRQLMKEKQVYLDDGLSLATLAQLLKIPKHHLSQVFSIRIGKNFNTYINEHRINHSIMLMRSHPEMTIAEIFFNSGFTAKASFNRYFKQFHGCTPTEYRSRIAAK